MLILFDHGTPLGLAGALVDHIVVTAYQQGWDRLSNGTLLAAAEESGFDLMVTTDRRIRYQQNLSGRKIAIVVVRGCTKWSQVRLHIERIASVVGEVKAGSYAEVEIPFHHAGGTVLDQGV